MKKINLILSSFFIIMVTILTSCKETEEFNFDDIDENEATLFNDSLDAKSNKVAGLTSRGKTWKAWNQYFKDCIKNVVFQKAEFAGYSNSINVGNLRLKDGTKGFELRDFLTPAELDKLIDTTSNSANGCNNNFIKEITLNNTIGADFLNVAELELKAQASLIDTCKISIDQYKIIELNIDLLKKMLNENEKLKDFRKSLEDDKRRIIVQAVKAKGTKIEYKLKREIQPSLSAKLDSTITQKLKMDGVDVNLAFKKINNKSIICETDDEFFIMVTLKKKLK